jgi:carbamoyl-phosphate synthase large subunit
MEHVELAGVHSGDSACMIPSQNLSSDVQDVIRQHTHALARELHVCGLMNIQFAVQDGVVYILEVNPRASRTVPFVSKAIGVPLAKLAALVMAGKKLPDLGFTEEIIPKHCCVKEAVFPFVRFPGIDVILSPEMKSTGEVMGIDFTVGGAFIKSQTAAGNRIPVDGNVFLSVRDQDKDAVVSLAKRLVDFGFSIFATSGTSTVLYDAGIETHAIFKISDGRPSAVDLIEDKRVGWIVSTPSGGAMPQLDEVKMRAHAVTRGIPITTTIDGLRAAINGLYAMRKTEGVEVCSLQEYHRHSPKLKLT